MNIVIPVLLYLLVLYTLWKWYKPKIDIVELTKGYRIYLSYIIHNETDKRRVYKLLFQI